MSFFKLKNKIFKLLLLNNLKILNYQFAGQFIKIFKSLINNLHKIFYL